MDLLAILREQVLILDGATGTMLQKAGLTPGAIPEEMNLTHPEVLTKIHRAYVKAGADVVTANTFQAGELRLEHSSYAVETVIGAGIKNAKSSGAKYVALDLGPVGPLLRPNGNVSFQRAYEIFRRQVRAGARAGADLILIETLSDLHEAKAAVLAAKENCGLPVFCSLTYQEGRRTFLGCDPMTAAITLSGLGVDALGVNCSLGPMELMPVVDILLRYSRVPVFVQPNAGLPETVDGEVTYHVTPEKFASAVASMVTGGVRIAGGCCGTTPEHIAALKSAVAGIPYAEPHRARYTAATSGRRTALFRGVTLIGERINPSGRQDLEAALRETELDDVVDEAIDQAEAGANLLDVNVSLPGVDEAELLPRVVTEIQAAVDAPLMIDSVDPAAIEAAVRAYNGKPVINSVNGKLESLYSILPIAKKYGALIVALTLNEDGVPATAESRVSIARKIVAMAECEGIPREDVLIDCLALTAASQPDQVMETLRAVRMVKAELGVKTVLGVSNVSYDMPGRDSLNAVFLAAALGAGLDAPIANPLSDRVRDAVRCFRALTNATPS